jgi:hypothetical protein
MKKPDHPRVPQPPPDDLPSDLEKAWRFQMNQNRELAAGTEILMAEIAKLKAELARVANENAALVAQLPHGFAFPKDGDCRMVD